MRTNNLGSKFFTIKIVIISSLLIFSIGCSSTLKEISSELDNLQNTINSEIEKLENSVNQKSNAQKKVLTEVKINNELVDFSKSEAIYYAYSWGKNINLDKGTKINPLIVENFYRYWHEYKDNYYFKNSTSNNYWTRVGEGTLGRMSFDDLDKFIKTNSMKKSENLVFEIPFKESMYGNDEDFKLDQYSLKYENRLKESFNYYNNTFFNNNLNELLSLADFDTASTGNKIKKFYKRIKSICSYDLEPTSIQQKNLLNKFINVDGICSKNSSEKDMIESLNFLANIHGYSLEFDSSGTKFTGSSSILLDQSGVFKKLNISEIADAKIYLNNMSISSHKINEFFKDQKLSKNSLQGYINSIHERLFEEILFTSYYGYPPINAEIYFVSLLKEIDKNFLEGVSGTKDIEFRIIDSDLTNEQFDLIFRMVESMRLNDRQKLIIEKYKNIVAVNFDEINSLREIKIKSDAKNKSIENFQSAYVAYLNYKACYTSREGYMSVYITKDQHTETEKQWRLFKEASPLSSEEQEKAIIDAENRPNFGLIKMLGKPNSNYSDQMRQDCSMYMLIEDRFSNYK